MDDVLNEYPVQTYIYSFPLTCVHCATLLSSQRTVELGLPEFKLMKPYFRDIKLNKRGDSQTGNLYKHYDSGFDLCPGPHHKKTYTSELFDQSNNNIILL